MARRFFDATWPLYVNTAFVVIVVWTTGHGAVAAHPSAGQRLLELAALLAVAGLFLIGTWRRARVVEGLVAVLYGYEAIVRVARALVHGVFGGVYVKPALRLPVLAGFWAGCLLLAGLGVYFAGRFARPPGPPASQRP